MSPLAEAAALIRGVLPWANDGLSTSCRADLQRALALLRTAGDNPLEAAIIQTQDDISRAQDLPTPVQLATILPLQRHLSTLLEMRAIRLAHASPMNSEKGDSHEQ